MKTVCSCKELKESVASCKIALLVASAFASSVATAANDWAGVDGADLATPSNWSDNALPTGAPGYFNGRNEHGTDYTVTLSKDESFRQFIWGGSGTAAKSTVIDLCGHTLSLTLTGARPIRIEKEGQAVTVTNGVLSFSSETAWLLGSNQTLAFGEGVVFNGNAALHAAGNTPGTGSRIVVKDGAKVNGLLNFSQYQSEGEILVTGEDSVVDFNNAGALVIGGQLSSSNNTYRIEKGASVVDATSVEIGYTSTSGSTSVGKGNRIAVESRSTLFTKNWDKDGSSGVTLGKANVEGRNEIFVGDGSTFASRTIIVYGTGNSISLSNGTFKVVKYTISAGSAFRLAGSSPKLYQTGQNGFSLGAGCTFAFDIPAGGYAVRDGYANAAPCDFIPSGDVTVPEDTQLSINAAQYAKAGGGTVSLMAFRGARTITFSQTLLDRWNAELADRNCSVAWDPSSRQLTCTVKAKSGLIISLK